MIQTDICIIGAGASGLMAAVFAAVSPFKVLLIEKNTACGRKLSITGKGRCNITNTADVEESLRNVPGSGKFLYSAFHAMNNRDIVRFFEERGLETVAERGGRIFTKSGKAQDVTELLRRTAVSNGVQLLLGDTVIHARSVNGATETDTGSIFDKTAELTTGAVKVMKNGVEEAVTTDSPVRFSVRLKSGREVRSRALIIATGGLSYPGTGSTGDGYRWAEAFGHSIIAPKPSLVPLVTKEKWPSRLSGLTLKNVVLTLYAPDGPSLYSELGEMLFTHFGISGPLVLSGSRYLSKYEFQDCRVSIDLKPGLSEEKLYRRITRDFELYSRKSLRNALKDLLPSGLIPILIEQSGCDGELCVSEITREQKNRLVSVFKGLPLTVTASRPIAEAIITAGGVKTTEINPSTLESKRVPRLYFCGEVLDVDAFTGGFNLSIAFSTGFLAGKSAGQSLPQ